MSESAVLVTGATAGLGKHTAIRLAERGWHVVVGYRDRVRADATLAAIRRRVGTAHVEALHLDLADLRAVAGAAAELRRPAGRPPLRAVVGNGGIQVVDGVRSSVDGYELTFATNHLGHHHLVGSLLDVLTQGARIVIVSSGTHWGPEKSFGFPAPEWRHPRELANPALADPSPTAGRSRYSTSKLANLMFTYELARRASDAGITANAYDPGLMPGTALSRDYPAAARAGYRLAAPAIAALLPGARTARRSSAHLADLVTSPRFADTTAAYVVGREIEESSPLSRDLDRSRELWTVSDALVDEARN